MKKKLVSFRCPFDVADAMQKHLDSNGLIKEWWLTKIIREALDSESKLKPAKGK